MKTKMIVVVVSLLSLSAALAASIVGVGLELYRPDKQAPVTVKRVLPDSPAWKAGIKPECSILSIDGTNTADMSLWECADLIRGAPGTQVSLGVFDPTVHQTNTVTLKRVSIHYTPPTE